MKFILIFCYFSVIETNNVFWWHANVQLRFFFFLSQCQLVKRTSSRKFIWTKIVIQEQEMFFLLTDNHHLNKFPWINRVDLIWFFRWKKYGTTEQKNMLKRSNTTENFFFSFTQNSQLRKCVNLFFCYSHSNFYN